MPFCFKVSAAAAKGRLLEAFHSCRSEHGMPAHKVRACWVEFAAFEAHFNGDRSQNTGVTGKRWKPRNPDIDPLYGLLGHAPQDVGAGLRVNSSPGV